MDIWVSSEAKFTIYDDDEEAGTSELMRCHAKMTGEGMMLDVSMSKRTFIAKFNNTGCPTKVCLNGVDLPKLTSLEDLEGAEGGRCFDPSFTVYAKFNGRGSRSQLTIQA